MRALNLVVKFLLELVALGGLAVWGWETGGLLLAVTAPLVGATAWGLWAAPKARWRLPTRWRIPFELAFFALAVAAWWATGHPTAAVVLGVVTVLNAIGLTLWRQWEH